MVEYRTLSQHLRLLAGAIITSALVRTFVTLQVNLDQGLIFEATAVMSLYLLVLATDGI